MSKPLSPVQKEIVRLLIEGFTYQEVAEYLGKSKAAITSTISRIADNQGLHSTRKTDVLKICKERKLLWYQ